MKRILLVEDDLSLINGLSFAVKSRGISLMLHTPAVRQTAYGKQEDMIW